MTSPRIWDDPTPLSGVDQRDELVRQLQRLPGVVAVQVDHDLDLIRVALDPAMPGAVSITALATQLQARAKPPRTIEIATPASPKAAPG